MANAIESALRIAETPDYTKEDPAVVQRALEKIEKAPTDKGDRWVERQLLNLYRKLRNPEKIALYILAERLASNRIKERVINRSASRQARADRMEHHV